MKFDSIGAVTKHIETLSALNLLEVADFAPLGGAADVVANDLKGRSQTDKSSQLRKFFDGIKSIKQELLGKGPEDDLELTKIYLIMPQLAYARGRNLISLEFYNLMLACLDPKRLRKVKDFERLIDFLQAILAYHKMHTLKQGGR